MKKIFKALAVAAASTALCAGIAMTTTGCSAGFNGTYIGSYHYTNEHGSTYGMVVEVTVENNIITKVKDLTNSERDEAVALQKDKDGKAQTWTVVSAAMPAYGWDESAVKNWNDNESLLLQKYEGWAVSDILDIQVFIKETGEPYSKGDNAAMSDLIVTGASQGSGRLMLAVQDALGKTTEIGRIER